jgi:hypothetical protein
VMCFDSVHRFAVLLDMVSFDLISCNELDCLCLYFVAIANDLVWFGIVFSKSRICSYMCVVWKCLLWVENVFYTFTVRKAYAHKN